MLCSVYFYAISEFQFLAENGAEHIEHILNQSREILNQFDG